jgi:hypothetical protein
MRTLDRIKEADLPLSSDDTKYLIKVAVASSKLQTALHDLHRGVDGGHPRFLEVISNIFELTNQEDE